MIKVFPYDAEAVEVREFERRMQDALPEIVRAYKTGEIQSPYPLAGYGLHEDYYPRKYAVMEYIPLVTIFDKVGSFSGKYCDLNSFTRYLETIPDSQQRNLTAMKALRRVAEFYQSAAQRGIGFGHDFKGDSFHIKFDDNGQPDFSQVKVMDIGYMLKRWREVFAYELATFRNLYRHVIPLQDSYISIGAKETKSPFRKTVEFYALDRPLQDFILRTCATAIESYSDYTGDSLIDFFKPGLIHQDKAGEIAAIQQRGGQFKDWVEVIAEIDKLIAHFSPP